MRRRCSEGLAHGQRTEPAREVCGDNTEVRNDSDGLIRKYNRALFQLGPRDAARAAHADMSDTGRADPARLRARGGVLNSRTRLNYRPKPLADSSQCCDSKSAYTYGSFGLRGSKSAYRSRFV